MTGLPPGIDSRRVGAFLLLASPADARALLAAGLGDPLRWPRPDPEERRQAGRGAVLRRTLPDGRRLVLKQLRRGGIAAKLWRERFRGVSRLVDNLALPLEAARRGVPTAEPIGLWLLAGPPGFHRGWLAVREISSAIDLLTALAGPRAPAPEALQAAIAAVRRMHDAGIDHRDLNLGNLLIRSTSGRTEGFVIDLDRARMHPEPLPVIARRRALSRLERSYRKHFAAAPAGPADPDRWREWYAGPDRRLAEALSGARAVERLSLAIHRLGWALRRAPRPADRGARDGPQPRGPSPR